MTLHDQQFLTSKNSCILFKIGLKVSPFKRRAIDAAATVNGPSLGRAVSRERVKVKQYLPL